MSKAKAKKRGQKPSKIQFDDDWQVAINKALKKQKPKEGWPKK